MGDPFATGEFYDLMTAFREADASDLCEVGERYATVKAFLRRHFVVRDGGEVTASPGEAEKEKRETVELFCLGCRRSWVAEHVFSLRWSTPDRWEPESGNLCSVCGALAATFESLSRLQEGYAELCQRWVRATEAFQVFVERSSLELRGE